MVNTFFEYHNPPQEGVFIIRIDPFNILKVWRTNRKLQYCIFSTFTSLTECVVGLQLGKGSVTQKEGIQYTNEAFENDEDGYSTGSGTPKRGSIMLSEEPGKATGNLPVNEAVVKSSLARHALLRDDASEAGSDKTDSDKEVKPILTKERRMDEGYKSVWFKEDIDPNAKEEVVIIPDSREHDSEDEDEDDNPSIKTPRVVFNETDLDSGLGVKMEDPAESSEDDDFSNVHLWVAPKGRTTTRRGSTLKISFLQHSVWAVYYRWPVAQIHNWTHLMETF